MTRLAVVGTGSIGTQIARQAALRSVKVGLNDVSREQFEMGTASDRESG